MTERMHISVTDNIDDMCDRAELVLRNHPKVNVYQRGASLVQIQRHLSGVTIEPIRLATLTRLLSGTICWEKFKVDKKTGDASSYGVLPPPEVVSAIHAAGRWEFRELRGLIHTPTLRTDGTILSKPGYDSQSGLFHAPSLPRLGVLPENPSLDDARKSLVVLDSAFVDFPFGGDEFKSACYSCLLTLLIRPSIAGAIPVFAFEAPARGSGKSLLVRFVATLATGREPSAAPPPRDEDEENKRITVQIAKGASVIWVDNVLGRFGSSSLAALITAPFWDDRLIGGSASGPWPNLTTWLVTGNNLTFHPELARRVVPIFLDTGMERPEQRTGFEHPNALAWAQSERAAVVAAGLTMLRAYVVAGRPPQAVQPYGSFEAWSDWVRSALVWAGMADPCQARDRITRETDSEEEAFGRMLVLWHQAWKDSSKSLREVMAVAKEELLEAFEILAPGKGKDRIDITRLGYIFRANKGHPIGFLRCVATGKCARGQQYSVKKAEQGAENVVPMFPKADKSTA